MADIKVNINQLKWNLAWVIMAIKAFLTQKLRLVALLVLHGDMTSQIFLSEEGNESSDSAIYVQSIPSLTIFLMGEFSTPGQKEVQNPEPPGL